MDYTSRHPDIQACLRFFAWEHLPVGLQVISRPFANLAYSLVEQLPNDPEPHKALDKLREAKDRAVALAAVTADA